MTLAVLAVAAAFMSVKPAAAQTVTAPWQCITAPSQVCPPGSPALVAADGGSGADAAGHVYYGGGSSVIGVSNIRLAAPIVGLRGGRLVAADGGVFAVPLPANPSPGFYGSMAGHRLAAPIVALAPTWSGRGYWLVGADGGVFSFGDARFYGSLAGHRLAAPIVDIESTSKGYFFVGADGGVFAFGDAPFYGSLAGHPLAGPIVSLANTPVGSGYSTNGTPIRPGYWLIGRDGGMFTFGGAPFLGSFVGTPDNHAVLTGSFYPDFAVLPIPNGYKGNVLWRYCIARTSGEVWCI